MVQNASVPAKNIQLSGLPFHINRETLIISIELLFTICL